jgi:HSP20 family molecular chaperone IbpA
MASFHQNNKTSTNARIIETWVALLILASIPEFAFANRRCHSHHRMYPRPYNSYWGNCGGYRSCGSIRRYDDSYWGNYGGYRPFGSRRYYGDAIDIVRDIVHAGMNSLVRQQRRNVVEDDNQIHRYSVDDYGRKGLELNVVVPNLTAREVDLEIIRENGVNVLLVSGNPGFRRRGHETVPKFSQSFIVNDDTIDVDGVTATISSEILTISLPRKKQRHRKRKRKAVPLKKDGNIDRDPRSKDGIVVFDSRSGPNEVAKERPTRQHVLVEETPAKTSDESNSIERDERSMDHDDDLYISEAEDIW